MLHYLPHIPFANATPEQLGTVLWLDKRYWDQMEIAINNGIARAFGDEV